MMILGRNLFVSIVLLFSAQAWTMTSEPLGITNQSPFARLRAFPGQQSAFVNEGWSWTLTGTLSNHFIVQQDARETLVLDGQTDSFALQGKYGFGQRWTIDFRLPWARHHKGFTDNLISDWHRTFGLPNGDRQNYPTDRLLYEHRQAAFLRILDQPVSGWGDLEFAIGQSLVQADFTQVSVGIGTKTATGDVNKWLGSGTTDFYSLVRLSHQQRGGLPLYWHGQVGITRAGRSTLIDNRQRRMLWFAGLSCEWRFKNKWSGLVQYDAHSALADKHLDSLDESAGMLSFAFRWRPKQLWEIDFGFSEDLAVESAPDITFFITIRYSGDN